MSFAALRKSPEHEDLAKLAEEHMQHDLDESDREVLKKAAGKVSLPATIGTLVGLGLGVYAAFRLRKVRMDMFRAFRASEKPTQVVFAGGRTESVPDVTPYLRPTRFGDIATYIFFGLGGTIVGGELGFVIGTWSAARTISRDPERRKRIETAYRRFKADYLRKEAKRLDDGGSVFSKSLL
ncbi:hypothetical protein JX265_007252 [Neoarthrinium moseri]|uniref:Transmembrane protein n=1 Tax=Neoarthrinium moseri TaxID=1658444 RepID=A0A9P9WJZ3_9PEZI|nr:uncharacterized protein JN550_012124 [Neoarthrinium moseri]KAI1850927.1 hypothetical protein JX266_003592 [Neoarthrinium moseri]KAI1859315.1 hypothetical protein JN550_012124 [Neoarthrinium moseri]KAI1867450.1 hypothetical protein JX265_007252 [Neoarthrinium moseri]